MSDNEKNHAELKAEAPQHAAWCRLMPDLGNDRILLHSPIPLRSGTGLEVVDSTPWVELRARQSGMNEPTQEPNPGADAPSPREHATGSVGEADVHDGNFAEAFEATNRSLAQLPCFCSLAARTPCAACTARAWLKPESPTPDNAALKQRVFSALGESLVLNLERGYPPDPGLVQQFGMLGRDL